MSADADADADAMATEAPPEPSLSPHTSPSPSAINQPSERVQAAVQSLSLILSPLADTLSSSEAPAATLFRHPDVVRSISQHMRRPEAGAGDDNLCRWLYDAFQSTEADLQLAVLSFVPTLVGVYLPRALGPKSLAGFEAVLLTLYAHETITRGGEPQTMQLPNLANPSVYHEAKAPPKKGPSEELNVETVLSPPLEPYGTMRSTKRARIVGVVLELYYSKISCMPESSKLEFCEFCKSWTGQELFPAKDVCKGDISGDSGDANDGGEEAKEEMGRTMERSGSRERRWRIPLPWELLQPILRIVGNCLLGTTGSEELKAAAYAAAECLHARATRGIDPRAILATRSLLRLGKMATDVVPEPTFTDGCIPDSPEPEAGKINA